jgi:hypothetical protein
MRRDVHARWMRRDEQQGWPFSRQAGDRGFEGGACSAALREPNRRPHQDGLARPQALQRWRQGQVDYLERIVQANLSRISKAVRIFRRWAVAKGLTASETHYVRRKSPGQTLRFSKSGNPGVERLYRTHWISRELSEEKRERLAGKASRPAAQREMEDREP